MHPYTRSQALQTMRQQEKLTQGAHKVGEVQIQLLDRDLDVEGLQTEARVAAIVRLPEALAVRGFQREGVEQDGNDQVQPPHLVCLSETVDTTHLPLLIRRGEHAAGAHLSGDGFEQILAVLGPNILA